MVTIPKWMVYDIVLPTLQDSNYIICGFSGFESQVIAIYPNYVYLRAIFPVFLGPPPAPGPAGRCSWAIAAAQALRGKPRGGKARSAWWPAWATREKIEKTWWKTIIFTDLISRNSRTFAETMRQEWLILVNNGLFDLDPNKYIHDAQWRALTSQPASCNF